jgi:replication factor A1
VAHWTKLGNLREGMRSVNVAGRVAHIGSERVFTRRDGSTGRVASVLLEDETGTVRLSLWDDDVDLTNDLEAGSILTVENGYTRLSLGDVGLNAGQSSRISINPEDVEVSAPRIEDKMVDVQDLREGQTNIFVRGRVLEPADVREVETARDLVSEAEKLSQGSLIRIENCNVRAPFEGLMQISSGMFTRIVVEEK